VVCSSGSANAGGGPAVVASVFSAGAPLVLFFHAGPQVLRVSQRVLEVPAPRARRMLQSVAVLFAPEGRVQTAG